MAKKHTSRTGMVTSYDRSSDKRTQAPSGAAFRLGADAAASWKNQQKSAEIQERRRARLTAATRSQFGRVPQDTVDLLTQHVRRVTGPIVAYMPLAMPAELTKYTVKAILDRTIRDWRENDNLSGLDNADISDLQSFIEAAAYLSDGARTPAGLAIYRVTLSALLDDWFSNWNAQGTSGPPLRGNVR